MPISKKVRFEVFKRDSFTCQYCGMAAPEVILHVDHIEPKSKGGSHNILNLLTSCSSCNSGKGARKLSDTTVVQKQKAMLDSLQERREQIEMMIQWQRGLEALDNEATTELAEFWQEMTQFGLNDQGHRNLKTWLKKFHLAEVMEAMRIASDFYLRYEKGKDTPTQDSVEQAFRALPGICVNRKREKDDPRLNTVNHARAIARKTTSYVNEGELRNLLFSAVQAGVDENDIFLTVRKVQSWSRLTESINDLIEEAQEP
jgi:Restriction endonuclease